MEENSRYALGRSGPRKKTGCFTCRRRKVRCDERKPVCHHCTRLRLHCRYKAAETAEESRTDNHGRSLNDHDGSGGGGGVDDGSRAGDQHRASRGQDFGAIDSDQFIGGLTAERHEKQQQQQQQQQNGIDNGSFVGGPATLNPAPSLLMFPNGISNTRTRPHSLIPEPPSLLMGGSSLHGSSASPPSATSASASGSTTATLEQQGGETSNLSITYEEQLLQHFRDAPPPDAIFAPLDIGWKFVKPAVLALARDFSPLMNAIYCYSGVQNLKQEGRGWQRTFSYYKTATADLQAYMTDDVGHNTLRKVFATVFFLMMAELLSDSELSGPNTPHLRSAHVLLGRYRNKTKSWRGVGRLFVSWIILLDVKALIAGRDGDVLVEPVTPPSSDFSDQPVPSEEGEEEDDDDEETVDETLSDPTFLLYNFILGPAFRFYVESQKINRRIVHIDLHHRARGTLSDEYEVLQIAHKVSADLEALWRARPRVIDIYDRPDELHGILTPDVATHICRAFRVYVANFLAQFIYLHRVAFSIYPRTDRVTGAVDKIIGIAGLELDAASKSHKRLLLPASFLWPLFIAGLEASVSQRDWIEAEMRRMAGTDGGNNMGDDGAVVQRHPNMEKALLLFEELSQRQNVLKVLADSRCVRRELFTDFFVMI